MRILFLARRLPTELLRGYEVRAYHQIRLLSERHRITLVAFASVQHATEQTRQVQACCENVYAVPLQPAEMATGIIRYGIGAGLPLQTAMYNTRPMRLVLERLLRNERFDIVHVQLARLANVFETACRAAQADTPGRRVPRVIDLIDALCLNMQRRNAFDRQVTRFAARFEARRLQRYEQALCARFDRALVASNVDVQAIGEHANLVVNPHGVDVGTPPIAPPVRQSNRILFHGNLGYFPNVDAVTWFAHEVLPRVRQQIPEARFVVAGARATRAVRALARLGPHVEVLGFVPDLTCEIRRSTVSVAPIRAGSGQPLKVLEAMGCGTPVVATPEAIGGVQVAHAQHLLVANDAITFADMVVRLLRDPHLACRLTSEARRLVAARYGWETSVAQLAAIYEDVCAGGPR